MKIIKEILKYIILIGSIISVSIFITLVAFITQNKLNRLIIIFSGLWIGIIILKSLCNMLWSEELIDKEYYYIIKDIGDKDERRNNN